ncbi:MAG: DUF2723 domain-containing protein [Bacteroidota bacterium]
MNNYNKLNNLLGWGAFLLAAVVYLSTIEPTASFWDCGEYILSCYKLEVGHPPGAPFFLLLGRFFTLFAGGDPSQAALWVNVMSALASAFTVLFLFWTITAFAKRIVAGMNGAAEMTRGQLWAILGSGFVGAAAYTFTDSAWFSAVEGEVYAMSSLCTALVFWAILKWERIADEPYADRWLIFIAYVMGLSIGVHLLNLLAIPAIVMIYYFKKFKTTRNGLILAIVISVLLLGAIMNVIIPGIVSLSASFEIFFKNSIGLPFNYGTIIYFILLIGGIVWGIRYSIQKKKYVMNTIVLSFAVLLIGYSSFFVLVIRSLSNTPMDQNNPENAINLYSYLKREQYGDWPLLYGQYYNSPLDADEPYIDGTPVYKRDDKAGKYVIADDRKNEKPNYDKRFCTVFPRMWSQQGNHEKAYQSWANIKGERIRYNNPFSGEVEDIVKPTFFENLKYFFKYQVSHMYMRYFMWNFVGRQNDIQGHGIEYTSQLEGNWVSGIPFIDELRLGNQAKLPESVTESKGNNKYYFLPLLLGLLGLVFHFNRNNKDAFVVLLLFFLTGLAIVIYLNQYPYQPRERDYSYAGSFYAFCIWIGLGVLALFDMLKQLRNQTLRAAVITVLCTLAVPGLLAAQNWDDHNRSNRYTCLDYARNYLESCARNAIIFTNGDNDTFPLWYVQEVEGIRTDVRVVNLSLANTDWYIEQLARKAYDSDPIPLTLTVDKYGLGKREWVPIRERKELTGFQDLKKMIEFVGDDENPKAKVQLGDEARNFFPTKNFRVPVDKNKVLANGTVLKRDTAFLVNAIEWTVSKNYLMKSDLLVLDIISANNWERPIYFSITTGSDAYINLQPFFQLEGLAYRLVPLKPDESKPLRIATDIMYENTMKKFAWGGLDKNEVYMDENNLRMAQTLRMQMITLAQALIQEGKKDKALEVLRKELQVLPEHNVPYYNEPYEYNTYLVQAFYDAGGYDEANKLAKRYAEILQGDIEYYLSLSGKDRNNMMREVYRKTDILERLVNFAKKAGQDATGKDLEQILNKYSAYLIPDKG